MPSLFMKRFLKRGAGLVVAILAASGIGLLTAGPAAATHYRATQITWTRTSAATVDFEVSGSWRCTYFFDPCSPAIGTTFTTYDPLDFGDNTQEVPSFTVTGVDAVNDVVNASAEVSHDYGSATGPFTASISTCCRLSSPLNINAADASFRVESIVDPAAASGSPESTISPIVDCPLNALCTFSVPAVDPDQHQLRFRFATSAESGIPDPPTPPYTPSAPSIDAVTGVLSWNTTGAQLNPDPMQDTFYAYQVMIEAISGGNVVTKTPVDFFVRLSSNTSNQPPAFTAPTPADAVTIDATVGHPVTFQVKAADPDSGDTVSLGMLNRPSDATYATSPGNPASGTFTWTPSVTGSVILVLSAADQNGLGATQRSVTINVKPAVPSATLSIADTQALEGNARVWTTLSFPVTLSAAQSGPVTVDYATSDGTATSKDYVATSGTLTIPAGQTTGKIDVKVLGDCNDEPNETFTVTLTNPSVPVTLAQATATGTIQNDDHHGGGGNGGGGHGHHNPPRPPKHH